MLFLVILQVPRSEGLPAQAVSVERHGVDEGAVAVEQVGAEATFRSFELQRGNGLLNRIADEWKERSEQGHDLIPRANPTGISTSGCRLLCTGQVWAARSSFSCFRSSGHGAHRILTVRR